MANIPLGSSPAKITASNTYELGAPSGSNTGTLSVQWVGSGFTGTVNTVGRVQGPANAAAPYVAVPYVPRNLAGTAQLDIPVIADLTGDFLLKVDASGDVIALVITVSAGSGLLYWSWIEGAAA